MVHNQYMKQIHFNITPKEETLLAELKARLEMSVAAIFRMALKILHKKETRSS